uniref:Uncharacterized protein n=1 Tax=Anopheles minimus TaxID=112268 RepID=A0A182WN39_9DIPT
ANRAVIALSDNKAHQIIAYFVILSLQRLLWSFNKCTPLMCLERLS